MKYKTKIAIELLMIFIFCANTYVGIEIVYRNFSDRSMWILAGFIGIFAYEINNTILNYDTDYLIPYNSSDLLSVRNVTNAWCTK